ncbi:hypothetical protein BaRGS_00015349, partial [Batillaria attramentaria]
MEPDGKLEWLPEGRGWFLDKIRASEKDDGWARGPVISSLLTRGRSEPGEDIASTLAMCILPNLLRAGWARVVYRGLSVILQRGLRVFQVVTLARTIWKLATLSAGGSKAHPEVVKTSRDSRDPRELHGGIGKVSKSLL